MDGVDVRWDEEVIKWLAVGMCLAMVGMAVMPGYCSANWHFTLTYHPEGAAIAAVSTSYESIVTVATAAALIACTLGAAGAAALLIMGAPIAVE